ncbi:MAG: hypothetical protein AAB036_04050 [Elusimicrobiota bacterium]
MKALALLFFFVPVCAFSEDDSSFYFYSSDGSTRTAVYFSITDPIGRRTGRLSDGTLVKQIPGSSYGTDSVDPEEGPEYGVENTVFHMTPVQAGIYTITILSAWSTNYEFMLSAHNSVYQDVSAVNLLRSPIIAGVAQQVEITFDPVSANRIDYKPVIDTSPLTAQAVGACSAVNLTGNVRMAGPVKVNGALTLSGNARIEGDATALPVNLSGNASITGTITRSSASLTCFPIDLTFTRQVLEASNDNASIPAGFLNGGVLRVTGNSTLTLPAGTYIVDRLEVSGNAKFRANGAVNLFVRQSASLSGNSETGALGAPITMLVESNSDQALSGKSIRATFYAPNAKAVLSGNALFSGRLHAGRVDMGGNSKVEAP